MKTATTPQRGRQATTASQSADMTDWTGADFDSWEALTFLNVSDPITCVTRARQERTR